MADARYDDPNPKTRRRIERACLLHWRGLNAADAGKMMGVKAATIHSYVGSALGQKILDGLVMELSEGIRAYSQEATLSALDVLMVIMRDKETPVKERIAASLGVLREFRYLNADVKASTGEIKPGVRLDDLSADGEDDLSVFGEA